MRSYEKLDDSLITQYLFHPRKGNESSNGKDIKIPVEDEFIGAKFFESGKENPTILFFHGNGEIVSDYNDIGDMYLSRDINFFAVDYRGYGVSTGELKASSMVEDSKRVFEYLKNYLDEKGFNGKLFVMGRSIGSVSALEISDNYPNDFDGLIIESGFAYTVPLLNILGLRNLNISEDEGFGNLEKIQEYTNPLLVIHAENDHIIPYSDGEELFKNCPSENKKLVKIDTADHNTIFYYGLNHYLDEVGIFVN